MLVIDGLDGIKELIQDEKRAAWRERERLLNHASQQGKYPEKAEVRALKPDAKYLEGKIHLANSLLADLDNAKIVFTPEPVKTHGCRWCDENFTSFTMLMTHAAVVHADELDAAIVRQGG